MRRSEPSYAPAPSDDEHKDRPCTQGRDRRSRRTHYEKQTAEPRRAQGSRGDGQDVRPSRASTTHPNRAFAAKLMKYAGWRSVTYRGNGVFDVDYHFEGRATQDFLFPALPDNDLIIPFIAIRRRSGRFGAGDRAGVHRRSRAAGRARWRCGGMPDRRTGPSRTRRAASPSSPTARS